MQTNSSLAQRIVCFGELLRKLYLIRDVLNDTFNDSVGQITSDGIGIDLALNTKIFELQKEINRILPSIERDIPEWALKRARDSFDTRSGFLIWDENY